MDVSVGFYFSKQSLAHYDSHSKSCIWKQGFPSKTSQKKDKPDALVLKYLLRQIQMGGIQINKDEMVNFIYKWAIRYCFAGPGLL